MWAHRVKPAKDYNINLAWHNLCNQISCHVLKQSSVAGRTFSILTREVYSDVALRQTYGQAESAANNLGGFLAIVRLARALWGIRESNRGISLSLKSHANRQDVKTQRFGTNVPICVPCGTLQKPSYGSWLCYVLTSPPACITLCSSAFGKHVCTRSWNLRQLINASLLYIFVTKSIDTEDNLDLSLDASFTEQWLQMFRFFTFQLHVLCISQRGMVMHVTPGP
jgi:hypothetical protein